MLSHPVPLSLRHECKAAAPLHDLCLSAVKAGTVLHTQQYSTSTFHSDVSLRERMTWQCFIFYLFLNHRVRFLVSLVDGEDEERGRRPTDKDKPQIWKKCRWTQGVTGTSKHDTPKRCHALPVRGSDRSQRWSHTFHHFTSLTLNMLQVPCEITGELIRGDVDAPESPPPRRPVYTSPCLIGGVQALFTPGLNICPERCDHR